MTGKQKAAMLLMSLDAVTAAELLKGLPPEEIRDIGTELAQLDTSNEQNNKNNINIAREFCESLQSTQTKTFGIKSFFSETLVHAVGQDKASQIQSQIIKATEQKNPFMAIRSASIDELVLALEGEHKQTIAVVLSELDPQKSQDVLSLLGEKSRLEAVCKMTSIGTLGQEVKHRIATTVCQRLKAFKGETLPVKQEQSLRKLAVMLSGLEKNLRTQMLDEIKKQDKKTSEMIKHLMVAWEDITSIADRSLQEALRSVESATLALALFGADEETAQKIRSNISERAAATLEEEMSLMQEPLEAEILKAREEVVNPLREANEKDALRFVQQK